ncbi:type II and III secretion system protein family protein [Vibrio nigripulchritudo]|uniref:type II and III secretion system protein family protein n=1 Tax=Vibrio nigripulchritudo TaxID=28173 RepID=UPI0024918B74|nr:pilus assembly protein N-terminal domain-containing protein [Vibrio nigripulchritudo]BDU39723.1 general secretion pathway protein GspD [Vibrio nigripulchritudo]BDU45446.1 general secretion pathway protein GspD [Vibrio nigripulchritudo]
MLVMFKRCSLILLVLFASFPSQAARIWNLAEGEARSLSTETEISSVFISNPKVADYQVIDKHKVVVFGKSLGSSSLLVFDEAGKTIASRNLVVNKSLVHIQQQVQLKYPHAEVTIYNLGEQVVLSGVVATEQEKDEINILVGELMGKKSQDYQIEWDLGENKYEMEFMKRRHFEGIVNHIEVASTKQVNVKLSIAEVSHSFLEKFGVEYGSAGQTAGTFVDLVTNFSAQDIVSVISASGDDTVGQILAEPNLSVISGESASFLVGGELPMVIYRDDITEIRFKEFGIRLELMAKVLRDEKIKLSLMPEVSSLDTQFANEKYNLPALKTRRARTTVELGDGQSFVLGGLLSTEDVESLRKVPYIGDIPILGSLFRKSDTKRNKTELIIVATVNLVKPIHPSQVQLPTMKKSSTLSRFFALDSKYQKASEKWANEILATGGFKQ